MRLGFSLVELSIVLVILGLLTGGILTGQNLIRAAELRSVTTQFSSYQTAFYTFRDKYFALPGDMTNATDFWGADPDGCPGDETDTTPTAATCDGDGNGQIGRNPGGAGAALTVASNLESFRAWQQLANAGLIEGSYTGSPEVSNFTQGVLGENLPRSKISNAGFNVHYEGSGDGWRFEGVFLGNFLLFGSDASQTTHQPVLTNEEAWNIDTKLDDGKPGTGNIMTLDGSSTISGGNCADSDTPELANYQLDQTAAACTLIMRLGI